MLDSMTATTTIHPGTVRIDNGLPLPAELAIRTHTSWLPAGVTEPYTDPGWEFIDGAGHWHGFTEDAGLLPTLTSTDGVTRCPGGRRCRRPGCPGWHLPTFTCRLCHEPVTVPLRPAHVTDPATAIPTVGWWTAAVAHDLPAGRVVQARFTLPDRTEMIGIAATAAGQLDGKGDLATRGAAGVAPMRFHQLSPPA